MAYNGWGCVALPSFGNDIQPLLCNGFLINNLITNTMKREIKFRAWIPELGIMLNDITLYGNGQMGYDEDEFKEALPKDHVLDYDCEGVIKNYINDEGDEDFDKVMPLLLGEDWIWLQGNEFEPMQFTELKDKNGKEIYEGDIVKHFGQHDNEGINSLCISICKVQYLDNMACFSPFNDLSWGSVDPEDYEIIGNIFENPEFLEAVA